MSMTRVEALARRAVKAFVALSLLTVVPTSGDMLRKLGEKADQVQVSPTDGTLEYEVYDARHNESFAVIYVSGGTVPEYIIEATGRIEAYNYEGGDEQSPREKKPKGDEGGEGELYSSNRGKGKGKGRGHYHEDTYSPSSPVGMMPAGDMPVVATRAPSTKYPPKGSKKTRAPSVDGKGSNITNRPTPVKGSEPPSTKGPAEGKGSSKKKEDKSGKGEKGSKSVVLRPDSEDAPYYTGTSKKKSSSKDKGDISKSEKAKKSSKDSAASKSKKKKKKSKSKSKLVVKSSKSLSRPRPRPTPKPTLVPTPKSSPVPTPKSSPVPTPTSQPVPTPTSSPVPTPKSSPKLSPAPTPNPTSNPSSSPTATAAPSTSQLPSVEPTVSPGPTATAMPTFLETTDAPSMPSPLTPQPTPPPTPLAPTSSLPTPVVAPTTEPMRINAVLSPYSLGFTVSDNRIPFRSEFLEVVALTDRYLDEYFGMVFSRTQLSTLIDTVTEFTDSSFEFGQPIQVELLTTLVFDDSSSVIPDIAILDQALAEAFSGDALTGYIGMVQMLPPSNVFSTTTGVEYVVLPDNNTSGGPSSTASTAGAIAGAAGFVFILAGVVVYGRRRRRRRLESEPLVEEKTKSPSEETVAGETYTGSWSVDQSETQPFRSYDDGGDTMRFDADDADAEDHDDDDDIPVDDDSDEGMIPFNDDDSDIVGLACNLDQTMHIVPRS